ncbi:MAG: LLM class flavin-dependent oxidoreductase [Chloroflexi bacterium]|nr:LLM class flavin-dependent oxidoreductase [Chloroflexota bacterium]
MTIRPSLAGSLRELVDVARAAEVAGFSTLYVGERHFDSETGFANAFAIAAALACRLTGAWIGVRPAIGLDHPLRLVEQSNALDLLTAGRCLIVLADEFDSDAVTAFGLPRGGGEPLIDAAATAWDHEYQEDGPALELHAGSFAARMAGRLMPAPFRQRHPVLALETPSEAGVQAAAQRGWALQLNASNPAEVQHLAGVYRRALAAAAHPLAVTELCLDRLTAVAATRGDDVAGLIRGYEGAEVAELRLDPAPGVLLESLAGHQIVGGR